MPPLSVIKKRGLPKKVKERLQKGTWTPYSDADFDKYREQFGIQLFTPVMCNIGTFKGIFKKPNDPDDIGLPLFSNPITLTPGTSIKSIQGIKSGEIEDMDKERRVSCVKKLDKSIKKIHKAAKRKRMKKEQQKIDNIEDIQVGESVRGNSTLEDNANIPTNISAGTSNHQEVEVAVEDILDSAYLNVEDIAEVVTIHTETNERTYLSAEGGAAIETTKMLKPKVAKIDENVEVIEIQSTDDEDFVEIETINVGRIEPIDSEYRATENRCEIEIILAELVEKVCQNLDAENISKSEKAKLVTKSKSRISENRIAVYKDVIEIIDLESESGSDTIDFKQSKVTEDFKTEDRPKASMKSEMTKPKYSENVKPGNGDATDPKKIDTINLKKLKTEDKGESKEMEKKEPKGITSYKPGDQIITVELKKKTPKKSETLKLGEGNKTKGLKITGSKTSASFVMDATKPKDLKKESKITFSIKVKETPVISTAEVFEISQKKPPKTQKAQARAPVTLEPRKFPKNQKRTPIPMITEPKKSPKNRKAQTMIPVTPEAKTPPKTVTLPKIPKVFNDGIPFEEIKSSYYSDEVAKILMSEGEVGIPVFNVADSSQIPAHVVKKLAWWFLTWEKDPPMKEIIHPELHDLDIFNNVDAFTVKEDEDISGCSSIGNVSDPDRKYKLLKPIVSINGEEYLGSDTLSRQIRDPTKWPENAFYSYWKHKKDVIYTKLSFTAKCLACQERVHGSNEFAAHIVNPVHISSFRNLSFKLADYPESSEAPTYEKVFRATPQTNYPDSELPAHLLEMLDDFTTSRIPSEIGDDENPDLYALKRDERLKPLKVILETRGAWDIDALKNWASATAQEKKLIKEYDRERDRYLAKPSSHPEHNDEWGNFWSTQRTKLEKAGKDTDDCENTIEIAWNKYWPIRLQTLLKDKAQKKIFNMRQELKMDYESLKNRVDTPGSSRPLQKQSTETKQPQRRSSSNDRNQAKKRCTRSRSRSNSSSSFRSSSSSSSRRSSSSSSRSRSRSRSNNRGRNRFPNNDNRKRRNSPSRNFRGRRNYRNYRNNKRRRCSPNNRGRGRGRQFFDHCDRENDKRGRGNARNRDNTPANWKAPFKAQAVDPTQKQHQPRDLPVFKALAVDQSQKQQQSKGPPPVINTCAPDPRLNRPPNNYSPRNNAPPPPMENSPPLPPDDYPQLPPPPRDNPRLPPPENSPPRPPPPQHSPPRPPPPPNSPPLPPNECRRMISDNYVRRLPLPKDYRRMTPSNSPPMSVNVFQPTTPENYPPISPHNYPVQSPPGISSISMSPGNYPRDRNNHRNNNIPTDYNSWEQVPSNHLSTWGVRGNNGPTWDTRANNESMWDSRGNNEPTWDVRGYNEPNWDVRGNNEPIWEGPMNDESIWDLHGNDASTYRSQYY